MESINLNLIPQGANPVVHAKQFDEGRGFRFNLFNGTAPIVLTGAETITCNVKKPDGNLVTVAVTNTSSNYVEVYTTLQMCACYGANLGEIRLEEDGNDIGTLNFTLSVEESPLNNGIESESSIHNLNTMVDGMVAEEVAEQYDSANVIFDANPTSGHGNGYTVTSEGIKTALSGKVDTTDFTADNLPITSGSATNTKDYIDSGLSGKADSSDTYTKTEVDNIVAGRKCITYSLVTLSTLTGTEATFNTFSSRKFSDYDLYIFTFGDSATYMRRTAIVTKSQWVSGASVSEGVLHGSGSSSASDYSYCGMVISYNSDTSVKGRVLGSEAINKFSVIGIKY